MFNKELLAQLREPSAMSTSMAVSVDAFLSRQNANVKQLHCSYEELVDVAYDYSESDLVVAALELIAFDRDPKCKVELRDLMGAHPDDNARNCARRLLSNINVLEIAGEFCASKHKTKQ